MIFPNFIRIAYEHNFQLMTFFKCVMLIVLFTQHYSTPPKSQISVVLKKFVSKGFNSEFDIAGF